MASENDGVAVVRVWYERLPQGAVFRARVTYSSGPGSLARSEWFGEPQQVIATLQRWLQQQADAQ